MHVHRAFCAFRVALCDAVYDLTVGLDGFLTQRPVGDIDKYGDGRVDDRNQLFHHAVAAAGGNQCVKADSASMWSRPDWISSSIWPHWSLISLDLFRRRGSAAIMAISGSNIRRTLTKVQCQLGLVFYKGKAQRIVGDPLPLGDESAGAAPDLQNLPGYQDFDGPRMVVRLTFIILPSSNSLGILAPTSRLLSII